MLILGKFLSRDSQWPQHSSCIHKWWCPLCCTVTNPRTGLGEGNNCRPPLHIEWLTKAQSTYISCRVSIKNINCLPPSVHVKGVSWHPTALRARYEAHQCKGRSDKEKTPAWREAATWFLASHVWWNQKKNTRVCICWFLKDNVFDQLFGREIPNTLWMWPSHEGIVFRIFFQD